MPRAAFVMEQQLGHATFYQYLQQRLGNSAEIDINWVPVRYDRKTNQLWEKIPKLPSRVQGILRARYDVHQGLKQKPWDVAFFNTHVPARMAGGLLKSGLAQSRPYVITTDITPLLHDTMSAHYGRPVTKNKLLRAYKHHHHVSMFRNAQRILPWSNWVRESLISEYGVEPHRIQVIPPGVDLDLWRPGDGVDTAAAEDKPVRILFVGGDFHRKGGDLVLRAFAKLPKGQATLDIVTRTQLDGGPDITVHNGIEPNSPKLLELYQSSHLFVFPTQAEAFGIVAAEAAATGLPVIATDVGGLSDIVVHGENGFLFAHDDEVQLAAHLQEVIEQPGLRAQMGAAGRARAEKLFDADKNAKRVLEAVIEAAQLDNG